MLSNKKTYAGCMVPIQLQLYLTQICLKYDRVHVQCECVLCIIGQKYYNVGITWDLSTIPLRVIQYLLSIRVRRKALLCWTNMSSSIPVCMLTWDFFERDAHMVDGTYSVRGVSCSYCSEISTTACVPRVLFVVSDSRFRRVTREYFSSILFFFFQA